MKPWLAPLVIVSLAGCSTAAQISGLAAGGMAGAVTANPAVGYAVGIGTAVAFDELFKWFGRSRAHAEQLAIARVAADLPEGGEAAWRIRHTIPFGNESGKVHVIRAIDTPLATCRQLVFSVETRPPAAPEWYSANICRDTEGWDWADAEPAVPRWGFLQ